MFDHHPFLSQQDNYMGGTSRGADTSFPVSVTVSSNSTMLVALE